MKLCDKHILSIFVENQLSWAIDPGSSIRRCPAIAPYHFLHPIGHTGIQILEISSLAAKTLPIGYNYWLQCGTISRENTLPTSRSFRPEVLDWIEIRTVWWSDQICYLRMVREPCIGITRSMNRIVILRKRCDILLNIVMWFWCVKGIKRKEELGVFTE